MTQMSIATARPKSRKLMKEARPSIEPLARMGYAAKGVVYLMIGVMSGLFAIGKRSEPPDFSAVLLQIFREPFGEVLLAALTIGLFVADCNRDRFNRLRRLHAAFGVAPSN